MNFDEFFWIFSSKSQSLISYNLAARVGAPEHDFDFLGLSQMIWRPTFLSRQHVMIYKEIECLEAVDILFQGLSVTFHCQIPIVHCLVNFTSQQIYWVFNLQLNLLLFID